MSDSRLRPGSARAAIAVLAVISVSLGGAAYVLRSEPVPDEPRPAPVEATAKAVRDFCGACHAYPPPDTLPRSAWRKEVKQGYDFFYRSVMQRETFPPLEEVVVYYESRAPAELELPARAPATAAAPLRLIRTGLRAGSEAGPPFVSSVIAATLFDERRPDLIVCEAGRGEIAVLRAGQEPPAYQVVGKAPAPARAAVVDLDGDGKKDILVAALGNFFASDDRVGSVVWLRQTREGRFDPLSLLEGVGRVADVQAADFNADGKVDLVVAVFGWRETGEILLLENQTADWSRPAFLPRRLDDRHGAIHVPVADLNGDGRPDFIALISQEHETLVAFLNEGDCKFRKEVIFAAPHPTYGVSGIELADLDRDGDLDVLLTNGDALDAPYVLKPYHGVQWLENRGTFPFTHHPLVAMGGAERAVAGDLDGDGDLDVIAVAFLPEEHFPQRKELGLDAVVWLEQAAPGRFVRHVLESETCDHLTCALADWDGDGRIDVIVGNAVRRRKQPEALVIWANGGGAKDVRR